jgi:hypothetical protein
MCRRWSFIDVVLEGQSWRARQAKPRGRPRRLSGLFQQGRSGKKTFIGEGRHCAMPSMSFFDDDRPVNGSAMMER